LGGYTVIGTKASTSSTAASMAILDLASASQSANVTVSANVTNLTTTGAYAALIARYTGTGDANASFYGAALVNTGGGNFLAQIWKDINGTFTELTNTAGSGGFGNLEFDVVGTSLRLFLNGTQVTSTSDGSITAAGSVGFRAASQAGIAFDTFTANPVTLPTLPYNTAFSPYQTNQLSNDWTNQIGAYTVSGTKASTSSTAASMAILNLASASQSANVTVSANVTNLMTTGAYAGLIARYTGTGDANASFYGAIIVNNGGGNFTAQIWKNVNGTFTQLASNIFSGGLGAGQLEFDVTGTSLQLKLNSNPVVSVTDGSITGAGSVGFRAQGQTGIAFDSFQAS
jgi:hypothetical protein